MKKVTILAAAAILFCSLGFAEKPVTSESASVDWKKAEKNYINLLQCENCGVRLSAISFIGEYKLKGATETLVKILKTDKSDQNRMASALSLVQLGGEESIKALEEAAVNDVSPIVAQFCKSLIESSNLRATASIG